MRIAVVDGMGGGLGAQIITKVKPLLSDKDEILALGANAIATAAMIKAGAAIGALNWTLSRSSSLTTFRSSASRPAYFRMRRAVDSTMRSAAP